MGNILHIISSARGEASNSIMLGNRIVEKLQQRHPGKELVTIDVTRQPYEQLHGELVTAYRTPQPSLTDAQQRLLQVSDEAVAQLMAADIIVIGVPLYNFQMPAALKAWIDHIVRPSKTVAYKDGMPAGLLSGQKAYLAIASNGIYSEGPMSPYDFAEPYLRYILGFLGITDVSTYRIEGAGMTATRDTAVAKGLASVESV
ncbi:FMN-dependent NADH-azoreductase [Chitinophaga qingshengii]|uniref:FMN dependent NADH:quinone oxidoreductase n=1 Tax=Chitinophaga qingshengii TaxID=1569794 RepID=A0ABR7TT56_9BACT|nr:NAD(P)H-dependent oxidoreductase [Chitinophaga qingshengii]MBC9933213.1 NAD(P)H-dependent oxidoreductase [Chitinophaga qingshengii]